MKYLFSAAILFGFFVSACNLQQACTEEFRTLGITIVGDELDEYFTIRVSTGDTIRNEDEFYPYQGFYPVLNDGFLQEIKGRQESFRFVGILNANMVVNETMVIRADACHISKVSGVDEVVL